MNNAEMIEKIKSDKFLAAMNKLLDRWKNVPFNRFFYDRKITFKPKLISYTLKHTDSILIISKNGGLVHDEENSREKIAELRVTAAMGDIDEKNGNGLGVESRNEIPPLKNIRALKKTLHNLTDEACKAAMYRYFDHHSYISEFKDPKHFEKLSPENPIEYYGTETELNLNIKKISEAVEKTDDKIQQLKLAEESEICFNARKVNRRFSSFERNEDEELRSDIFTSDIKGDLKIIIKIRDKEGGLVDYAVSKKWFPDSDINSLLNESLEEIKKIAAEFNRAPVQESGLYPAVLDPRALSVIIHEGFLAHLASSRMIQEEKATTFKNKVGQKILPDFITIIDDPTFETGFGSYLFDEEGVNSQKIELIKNGVLKTYLYDRIGAGRDKTKSNGHARASGNLTPEPRTTNLFVYSSLPCPKEKIFEMMIEECKKNNAPYGLYIASGAGEVDTESGQFKTYSLQIYRIYTDGRKEPASSAFTVDNAYQALNNIKAMSEDLISSIGFCGIDEDWVEIEEFCPYALTTIELRSSNEDIEEERLLEEEIENED